MRGPAGAPAAGLSLWERPPGTGTPRWSAAADPSGSSDTAKYLTRAISSAPFSSSQAPRLGPPGAAARWLHPPGPGSHSQGLGACGVDGQEQKPAIRAACLKLLERGRDPRGTLAE